MAAGKKCYCPGKPADEDSNLIDPEIMEKMELGFARLRKSDSASLLKRHLTPDLFNKLKTLKTSFGATLLDCIRSGLENYDSNVGVYASDPDAYKVFSEIFDPVIADYHTFHKWSKQPSVDWGDYSVLGDLDPEGDHVVSTRIRCGRSLACYPFNPVMTEDHYNEIEAKVYDVLKCLPDEYAGQYYPLGEMCDEEKQRLIDKHYLFKECNRFLRSANAYGFWPTGRGIFYNKQKTFLVWINEEDHVRVISMQPGGHIGQVYERLVNGISEMGKKLNFLRDERMGFLTFSPTNLGTAFRASVHAKLPKLAERGKLEQMADQYDLQIESTAEEHSKTKGCIYDISNRKRMGTSEFRIICEAYSGIRAVLGKEMRL